MKVQKLRIILRSMTLFGLVTSFVYAQNVWTMTYGGSQYDEASSVIESSDQSYVFTGYSDLSNNGADILLTKTDIYGNTIWTYTYEDEASYSYEVADAVVESSDLSYLLAGFVSVNWSPGNILLMKTDLNGNELWTRTYGRDRAYSVIQTSDEGYLLAGRAAPSGGSNFVATLIKTNMNGDTLWTKTYSEGGMASAVIETSDQAYLLAGFTRTYDGGSSDVLVIKTDSNGGVIWSQTVGGDHIDGAFSAIETSDQTYLVVGMTSSYGSGGYDVYLIKLSSNGEVLWSQTYGGTAWEMAYSIIETSDQAYIISGETSSYGSGQSDVWLVKTDINGEMIWSQTYGGIYNEGSASLIETSDEGYMSAGFTQSYGAGGRDALLIKTDLLGNTNPPTFIRHDGVKSHSYSLSISPNPTNSVCNFYYSLSDQTTVSLNIFDVRGESLWSREFQTQERGEYKYAWNTKDRNGVYLRSGVYIVQISTQSWVKSQKIILLK